MLDLLPTDLVGHGEDSEELHRAEGVACLSKADALRSPHPLPSILSSLPLIWRIVLTFPATSLPWHLLLIRQEELWACEVMGSK